MQNEEPKKKPPAWFVWGKKYEGKNENDPAFNREMSKRWAVFGMNLGTIKENWAAWCGLACAVTLIGANVGYQKDGSLAKNWDKYGVPIAWKVDGIPQGAIIRINHSYNCSSASGNHVTQADGDCTSADLLKPGATFNGYGGNQSNTWKVSTYSAREICSVRWPKETAKPGKILRSINCTGKKSGPESTR
jgi:hypothetical protein